MAHYAQIKNGIVQQVIVAEQEFIDTLKDKNDWIQTSYNSRGGVHYLPDSETPSGKPHLRYNYASIGYTYNKKLDAFIPPKQYKSWIFNKNKCLWEPPIKYPIDGKKYYWNEKQLNWMEIEDATKEG